ncbi:DUF1698 domain-containing protein [Planktothrix mougeotii LEGE 06226]|uniref:DUF1698 domain-containing protein n=1 Tax=Planktothrix mougeotii LEGE 06226 TaxID=1828728 RepID=A0ABR9UBZ0_9CYAN|nr:DUF1698 domain-containing protein [Planktothrix mougeotii LEGE 06226]
MTIPIETLKEQINLLSPWYHKIDFGYNIVTNAPADQSKVFEIIAPYLPEIQGKKVLELGSNASALSLEFIKRGAKVTAVEINPKYVAQANFVKQYFGLENLTIISEDVYNIHNLGQFDIVLCLGILYHVRYPQLLLDLCQYVCNGVMILSTQVCESDDFVMINRCSATNHNTEQNTDLLGWLINEKTVFKMLSSAGFSNIEKILNRKDKNYSISTGAHNDLYVIGENRSINRLPGFIKILKNR